MKTAVTLVLTGVTAQKPSWLTTFTAVHGDEGKDWTLRGIYTSSTMPNGRNQLEIELDIGVPKGL